MALEGLTDGVALAIPQAQGFIITAGDNPIPLGAKGHGPKPSRYGPGGGHRWGCPRDPTGAGFDHRCRRQSDPPRG